MPAGSCQAPEACEANTERLVGNASDAGQLRWKMDQEPEAAPRQTRKIAPASSHLADALVLMVDTICSSSTCRATAIFQARGPTLCNPTPRGSRLWCIIPDMCVHRTVSSGTELSNGCSLPLCLSCGSGASGVGHPTRVALFTPHLHLHRGRRCRSRLAG